MQTNELREKYLDFFQTKGHTICPSDVLVPTWDPSVLFTPAGMNQFKDHFLGRVKLDFTRATTCQKCLRTGDIDNVGRTAYHHTFFEMLGNFSFGDYFKREAINWAWEFLTETQWLDIDPGRLTVSVYKDDDEAAEIWSSDIHLTSDRIHRLDEDENFWPANAPSEGPDGVCGPCSEIFYHPDEGPEVEIWNLVFTQFNRVGDPPDNLRPLPSKNIDTGMGLERTAATLQGVATNFHIDILRPIVEAAADVCGVKYDYETEEGRRLRRITDHLRACTMAVHENVYPGPQKEKYVIRRLLRRAVLDGHQMGLREPFLHKIVPAVVQMMAPAYPDLNASVSRVADVIRSEETNFLGTLDGGLDRIERIFREMDAGNRTTIDGAEAAELYQTYGVPPELSEGLAAEHNLAFDWDGFRKAMEEHGEASGKVTHTVMGDTRPIDNIKKVLHESEFLGYDSCQAEAEVKFIVHDDQLCGRLDVTGEDHPATVVLDRTPFYGESGGQVGDIGEIVGRGIRFVVTDTQKDGGILQHHGYLADGEMNVGARVTARVDSGCRDAIRRSHSATHILHFALQKNLGQHAQQQGSKVDHDWLRFDFTNLSPVNDDQLATIQRDVDEKVHAALPISWEIVPLADARMAGAMMLFGEKYPDPVRMVSMGDFSKELCGGTHLASTGDVVSFEIISEESVSAGTRRIVALTGDKAAEHIQGIREAVICAAQAAGVPPQALPDAAAALAQSVRELKKQLAGGGQATSASGPVPSAAGEPTYADLKNALQGAARVLNVAPLDVPDRIVALQAEIAELHRQVEQREAAGPLSAEALLANADEVEGVRVIVAEAAAANPTLLRGLIDQLRKTASPVAVLLASCPGKDKVLLVAGVSHDLVDQGVHAGNWVRDVAAVVGGGGGGKPDMAQAGGKQPEKLPEALETARAKIRATLGG